MKAAARSLPAVSPARPERKRERHAKPRVIAHLYLRADKKDLKLPSVGDDESPVLELSARDTKRHLPMIAERECDELPRPCPFISCRYHLFLDVTPSGGIKLNFPDLLEADGTIRFDEMRDTCALDAAARGPQSLRAVAIRLNIVHERARQLLELMGPAVRVALSELQSRSEDE
jgi:hypothetical protein